MSSIMSGLAGALGGGGGDPGAPGGYGGDPGGGDPGADPSGGDTGQDQPQFSNSLEALDAAEEALHAFIQLDSDEGDRKVAATCLQNIIGLKAKNVQDMQSGSMTGLQRALSANAGPAAG